MAAAMKHKEWRCRGSSGGDVGSSGSGPDLVVPGGEGTEAERPEVARRGGAHGLKGFGFLGAGAAEIREGDEGGGGSRVYFEALHPERGINPRFPIKTPKRGINPRFGIKKVEARINSALWNKNAGPRINSALWAFL